MPVGFFSSAFVFEKCCDWESRCKETFHGVTVHRISSVIARIMGIQTMAEVSWLDEKTNQERSTAPTRFLKKNFLSRKVSLRSTGISDLLTQFGQEFQWLLPLLL